MDDKVVTVFGASGFLGRYIVRALAEKGYRIKAAVRRPHLAEFLKPAGNVGQIRLFAADLNNDASCRNAIEGSNGVINLVGILHESGAQKFQRLQAEAPGRLAAMARETGAETFIQVSAIGADAQSGAKYARTKAAGEAAVRDAFPQAHIVRPSIIFGTEDAFFNRFAAMARVAPALPLIGGGKTRFQPVYVDNVAQAVLELVMRPQMPGATWELGGPEIFTFKELMQLMLKVIGRKNLLVPIPFPVAKVQAFVLGLLPNPVLTMDQVELLKSDNVVGMTGEPVKTFADLDINPAAVETILPTYLYRFRKHGQFSQAVET